MAREKTQTILSVLLVEGQTEVVFYNEIKRLYLKNTTIEHLNGNFNINRKILDKITYKYSDRPVRVYCCVDRESRFGQVPNLDLDLIREEIVSKNFDNVLSIDSIIATKMIESWFFYDVSGIYTYLKMSSIYIIKRYLYWLLRIRSPFPSSFISPIAIPFSAVK